MTTATLTPFEIASVDAAYWVVMNKIRLQSGLFTFEGHEYQKDAMRSQCRRVVYMKATGGGFSELEILRTLHGMIHSRYAQGVLYLFPTASDVLDFSKARFATLLAMNPTAIGRFVKGAGKKGTDTAGLKNVNGSLLYLRGARMSNFMGDETEEKEASQLRGIQVDRVVFDEVGLMDSGSIAKAIGRTGHAVINGVKGVHEESYISNPGRPGDALDLLFQDSDQRFFYNKCECGHETCAVKSFPTCVRKRQDGTGYLVCDKCEKELRSVTKGAWRADWPSRTELAGYQWSHLNSTYHDPWKIVEAVNDPPQGNLSDVYRLQLGLSHQEKEDQLTAGMVFECCGPDVMADSSLGPCAMGVDVGKTMHFVVGTRTGRERFEILKVGQCSTWNDVHDVGRRFGVRSAVIDLRPYEDSAREFRKQHSYRVFLSEYVESGTVDLAFNDATGVVKVDRTSICDRTHRLIEQKEVVIPRRSPMVNEFANQVCSAAKVQDKNKRTGQVVFRYVQLGRSGDHFRHALNYFLIAARRCPMLSARNNSRQSAKAITEYALI